MYLGTLSTGTESSCSSSTVLKVLYLLVMTDWWVSELQAGSRRSGICPPSEIMVV